MHSATCVLSENFSILKKEKILKAPNLNGLSQLYLHAEIRCIGEKKPQKQQQMF